MERSRGIETIRRCGYIKQEELFDQEDNYLPIATTITSLICTIPQERPTATDLLNSVFNETNLEKTLNMEEIQMLKQKIITQDSEIKRQKELISQQQAEIQALKNCSKI